MTEADHLLAELDRAPTDTARAALLAGQPPEVLTAIAATLEYRAMCIETAEQQAQFDRFTSALDSASDNDGRLRLIAGAQADPQRGREWLVEWTLRRSEGAADSGARYFALLPAGAP